jgi:hypothetical protein
VSGPRDYTVGTRSALFEMARGTCNFPDCREPVVKHLISGPEVVADIAHIRAANRDGPRYDPSMTDSDRASYSNLILLCRAHHKVVDRAPDRFPADLLKSWKKTREEATVALTGTTFDLGKTAAGVFEALLREAVSDLGPQRRAEVDINAVLALPGRREAMNLPFEAVRSVREGNPHVASMPLWIAGTVRNVGSLRAFVKSVDLLFDVEVVPGHGPGSFGFLGTNELPELHPSLPHELRGGEAMNWFWSSRSIVETMERTARTRASLLSMFVRVGLSSGESIESPRVQWREVDDARPTQCHIQP